MFCTCIFSKRTVQIIESKNDEISCDLTASWTVQVGDMDQVVHLWRYTGGFEAIDQAKVSVGDDPIAYLCWSLLSLLVDSIANQKS